MASRKHDVDAAGAPNVLRALPLYYSRPFEPLAVHCLCTTADLSSHWTSLNARPLYGMISPASLQGFNEMKKPEVGGGAGRSPPHLQTQYSRDRVGKGFRMFSSPKSSVLA